MKNYTLEQINDGLIAYVSSSDKGYFIFVDYNLRLYPNRTYVYLSGEPIIDENVIWFSGTPIKTVYYEGYKGYKFFDKQEFDSIVEKIFINKEKSTIEKITNTNIFMRFINFITFNKFAISKILYGIKNGTYIYKKPGELSNYRIKVKDYYIRSKKEIKES